MKRRSKQDSLDILESHNIKLIGEFVNTTTPTQFKCGICSTEFETTVKFKLNQHKNGKILCQKCSDKIKDKKMRKINPSTGKSRYQEIAEKTASTMKNVGDDGLSQYEKNAEKLKKTVHTINPSTGLTLAKERGRKTKLNKSKVQDNGLTKYQETALASAKTKTITFLESLITKFPKISISTTVDEYLENKLLLYTCKKCNHKRTSFYPYLRCSKCYPHLTSSGELEVYEYCEFLVDTITNDRKIIKPLELDIILPNHDMAIEYDGIFWHSSYSIETENKNYHLNKTELCEAKGIQLFHIFENEWVDPTKQQIWKSIISNKLGKSTRLYARNCEIKTVANVEKCEFLEANHLQGVCQSSINLGLYHNDMLVSLMTFGKSRFSKKYDWELLRFCNILNTTIVGGASRLLKRFRTIKSGSIVSYADKRRSNGNLYKQLGFTHSHDSKPNYWYFKSIETGLESRVKYQKHKLNNMLENFDSNLTESENMYNNGYRKIYDCGNQVWVL